MRPPGISKAGNPENQHGNEADAGNYQQNELDHRGILVWPPWPPLGAEESSPPKKHGARPDRTAGRQRLNRNPDFLPWIGAPRFGRELTDFARAKEQSFRHGTSNTDFHCGIIITTSFKYFDMMAMN